MKVKVRISNQQSEVKIPSGLRMIVRRACHAVLTTEGYADDYEVSVSFVDNAQIRILNVDYRKKDMSTDVLSFPLMEDNNFDINPETNANMLGDIVISLETAKTQAESYGHSLQREVGFLTVHSMLHLLGYDHELGGLEETRMREQEEIVLNNLGLSRAESMTDYEE